MIALNCPGCQKKLSVKDELAGKKIKCPGCGTLVLVGETTAATLAQVKGSANLGEDRTIPPRAPDREEATLPAKSRSQAGNDSLSDSDDQTGPGGAASSLASPELTEFLAPAQQADEIGRLGPFRVLKVLGAGGMGVVYKAEDPQLKRPVALKAMLPGLGASESARKRFLREAQAAAHVVHDHIVPILQVGEDRGVPYIAMQFLEGEALDERLKRGGDLSMTEILRIGRETAEGLAAAHEKSLIHRDIKPANIWLEGKKGRVKILDFGLARAAADDSHLTQTGAILGTPAYMAPEQAAGEKVTDRCDLFSLGCVLYRMCTGQMPFKGKDSISTLVAVATESPAAPAEVNPQVPAELSDLVMKLLAKKPGKRPQSAHAVAETLQTIDPKTVELPARAVPKAKAQKGKDGGKTQVEPGRKPGTKKRLPLSWLIAGGVLGLVLVAAVIVIFWRSPHGLVRIESDDPNVEITFMKDGPVIKGAGKDPISIRSGEYSLLIKRGDFQFETNKLFIGKGKTVTLKIELLKGKVQVSADGYVLGAEEPPMAKSFKNGLGMEFVLVPKGKSWLGGGGGKQGPKEVEIAHDFYLGKYEVTQQEWEKVTGLNPSNFKAVPGVAKEDQKRFPVESVSWEDCQAFIERLNNKVKDAGWVYRLPKDAEWEYACRGGPLADQFDSTFDFYLEQPVNKLLPKQANFNNVLKRTCKVGSYKPNRLGLYDMHGNVWEWCEDEVPQPKGAWLRVNRGGGWNLDSEHGRAPNRGGYSPSLRHDALGLRLARVPVGKAIVKAPPPPEQIAEAGITEYSEVHQVDEKRFDAWIAQMKKEGFFPVSLNIMTVKDTPFYTAVAVKGKEKKIWEFTRAALDDPKRVSMFDKNYRCLAQCLYRTKDKGRLWEALLWVWPKGNSYALIWTANRATVDSKIEISRKQKARPIQRSAVLLDGGDIMYDVVFADAGGIPWLDSVDQSFEDCKSWIDKHKAKGWRPDHLYAYGSGPKTLFGNILLQTTGPDWDVSWALTPAQYEAELAQRRRQGFRPHSPVAHEDEKGDLRFSTMWIRYRSDTSGNDPATFKNTLGMEFVLVPKGTFLMGGGDGKPGTKEVPIKHDFYMGVYEVTQEDWEKVMGNNPSSFSRTGFNKESVRDVSDTELKRFPVDNVSWNDVQAFLVKFNKRFQEPGWTYRLPTEAEWEYACRGGPPRGKLDSTYDYYLDKPANNLLPDQANFNHSQDLRRPRKVGSYKPNRLGLFDMHGNVWEWCDDTFDDKGPERVNRGGCWNNFASMCRAANRFRSDPNDRLNGQGLRLARVPVGKELVVFPKKDLAMEFVEKPGGPMYLANQAGFKMEFVKVPKGKAWLLGGGNKPGDQPVEFKHDFYMGTFPVTQEEWQKVMGNNPSVFSHTGTEKNLVKGISEDIVKRFPVETVSWFDCQAFLLRLNELAKDSGYEYRLPTDEEWEYACRGGPMKDKASSAFDFYFDKPTNELKPNQANFGRAVGRPSKVGNYKPNTLGLYDMHGNVAQWVSYGQGYVSKGAGWVFEAAECRAANRRGAGPGHRAGDLGLRVVRVPAVKAAIPTDLIAYLSDLKEFDWKGFGIFGKNGRVVDPGRVADPAGVFTIFVNGVKSAKGLWMHPPDEGHASIKYNLDGLKAQVLKAKVAINDSADNSNSPLTFQVLGDGKVLWTSKPMQASHMPEDCLADVKGVRVLELRVLCPGGKISAHAVWVDPYLSASEIPKLPPAGKSFKNSLGMEFVLVPKGKAWLGGGGGKPGDKEIEVLHDFYLGRYTITQEEWQKVMGTNPSHFSRTGGGKDGVKDISDAELKRFPAEMVSWEDAQLFLQRLNDKEKESGWLYRLPTEVEWEYACRGGPIAKSESAFDFYLEKPTNQLQAGQANFEFGKSLKRPCKVGTYAPNGLGLYDMHANVFQWCDDTDKAGRRPRVIRGGSYHYGTSHCKTGYRDAIVQYTRSGDIGLRIARIPVGKEIVVFPKK